MFNKIRPRIDFFAPVQRSMRINGMSTCLRLEKIYWRILSDLAQQQRLPLSQVLSDWDIEASSHYEGLKNFSGFVRVMCVAHVIREVEDGFRIPELCQPLDQDRLGQVHRDAM
jgi:predicted DNA-binding ribbon-helix-helix protein